MLPQHAFPSAPQMRLQGEVKGMNTEEEWWQQTRWQLELFALAPAFQRSWLVNNQSPLCVSSLCSSPQCRCWGTLDFAQQSSLPLLWCWICTAPNWSKYHNYLEHDTKLEFETYESTQTQQCFFKGQVVCKLESDFKFSHFACLSALETLRLGVGWHCGCDPSQLSSF